jgi:hypothetical protein
MIKKRIALFFPFSVFVLTLNVSCLQRGNNSPNASYRDSDLRSIKGVQISTTGYETEFKIPFSQALAGDRKILFKRLTQSYVESLEGLRKDYSERKAKVKGFDKALEIEQYNDNIRLLVEKLVLDLDKNEKLKDKLKENASGQAAEVYVDISKQNLAHSYFIPQAVLLYGGGTFKIPYGATLKANVSLVYIAQMFVKVTIDNHSKKEVVTNSDGSPKRSFDVDGAFFIMPTGGAGLGFGFPEATYQLGAGLLFGPIDSPHKLGGYFGAYADVDLNSLLGGLSGKFLALGKPRKAPIYALLGGMAFGPSGNVSGTLGATALLDPLASLSWMGNGAKDSDLRSAAVLSELAKAAGESGLAQAIELELQ